MLHDSETNVSKDLIYTNFNYWVTKRISWNPCSNW